MTWAAARCLERETKNKELSSVKRFEGYEIQRKWEEFWINNCKVETFLSIDCCGISLAIISGDVPQ